MPNKILINFKKKKKALGKITELQIFSCMYLAVAKSVGMVLKNN